MEGLFKIMNIAASGMTAERFRTNIISQNLANAETTRTENGGPYQRKIVSFKEILDNETNSGGVKVSKLSKDTSPFKLVYDPNHPDADKNGYVKYPNVNVLREIVDMMNAQRAYELNASVVNTSKSMYNAALNIGR